MTIQTLIQHHTWLIPALPVLAFVNIAFVMLVAGRSQALARFAAPKLLIGFLAAALALSVAGLISVLGMADGAHGEGAVAWMTHTVRWMAPEPSSAGIDRTLTVGTLLDPLSAMMCVVVTLVSLLVQIYSYGYMKKEEHPRFYLYMSLFTASMLGLVLASTLLQMFLCWELVGLCSYLLIGFWFTKPEAARAAIKAFVVTRVGDLGFLIALIALWMGYGDLSFSNLAAQISAGNVPAALPVSLTAIGILLFIGACGKSAQFPLHTWLPDAMEGPTSVSALIHAATMVAAGVFLVARMFFLFEAAPVAMVVVALVGAFTAFFAASIALVQVDMKKVMAYSTISQLGYMMMGLGLAAPGAAFFHLTTHAFFKAMLFLTAGSVIHAVHTQNIWEMGGLGKKMKITAATCLIGGLALAGIFPLAGFFSKDKLLEAAEAAVAGHGHAALGQGLAVLVLVMALATVLMTAFYTTRMWVLVFLGKPRSHEADHAHEAAPTMTIPLIVLAALTLVAGWWLVPHLTGLQWGESNHFALTPLGIGAFALALGGIVGGCALYHKAPAQEPLRKLGPLYTGMVNLWGVDALCNWIAGRVVLTLGSFIAWWDKTVIDGGLVDGTAWSAGRLGHRLRLLGAGPLPGQLQYYALVIFVVAAVLLFGMSFSDSLDALRQGVMGR